MRREMVILLAAVDTTSILVAAIGLIGGAAATWASRRGKAKDEKAAQSELAWKQHQDVFNEVRDDRNELRKQLLETQERHGEAIVDLETRHRECTQREEKLHGRLIALQELVVGQISLSASQTELAMRTKSDDRDDAEAEFIKTFLQTMKLIGED